MKGLSRALRNEIDARSSTDAAGTRASGCRGPQMFQFLMEEGTHRAAIVNQMQRLAEGKGMKFERSASTKKALSKFKSPCSRTTS